jgi:hypothetical protein
MKNMQLFIVELIELFSIVNWIVWFVFTLK